MKPRIQWGRLLRRSLALFLATLAVWALLVCSGGGSAANAFRSLGQDPGFVSAALSAELGQVAEDDGPLSGLSGWARLVVDQSPLLRGNGDAVAGHLDGSAPATPDLPAGQPAQDHDDISEPPPETTAAPEDIIARTLVPTSTQGYEVSGSLYLYNRTGLDVDLAAAAAAPVNIALPAEGPQILIVHTHGSEAYTPDGTDIYEPSDNNTRTLDENYNVVRVGDEMERVFTELGLTVVHDRTLYDYPKYNGAYDRSAEAVQRYLEQYPSIKIVLDVHRDRGEVQRSPLKVGLYISFFPQLIAGPIVKYETVAQQIDHRKETWTDFSAGCSRFIVGLGKKVLLSNQLAVVADRAFGLGDGLSASFAWLGALCYTLQIYYDFSGYSDMAIGLGKMFGFHFLENFNYPYISRSITEFWRRWHISLSTWFRDYVYFPLGGSRVDSRAKHIRNLFVVWLLTGIWHGANWTFLAWGLFYFVLLVLEKYGHLGRGWPVWAKWLFTFLMVNFAWVLFRADSLAAAGQYLQAMFGLGAGGWDDLTALYLRENWTVLAASVLFAGPLAPRLRDWAAKKDSPLLDAGYAVLAAAVFLVSAAFLIKGTYNPFIYFNF